MNLRRALLFLVSGLLFQVSGAQSFPDHLFHPDTLRQRILLLSNDSMKGRFAGSPEAEKAANIITDIFKNIGLKPVAGMGGYLMPVPNLGANVIGAIQGKSKSNEIIIFSAHYDHVGTRRTNPFPFFNDSAERGDTIYNGANDDASGVVALMSLAAYYSRYVQTERTILFIAFTGEEGGMRGSRYFVNEVGLDSVKAVINIEMIGRENRHSRTPYITGDEISSLRGLLNQNLKNYSKKKYGKNYFTKDLYPEQGLYRRSDNFPFAEKGIVAHTIIMTAPDDQYYHSADDESSTLNYVLMSSVIKAIALSCQGFVEGKELPR